MIKYCYFNGKFIAENKARLGLYDLGLLRGYGVFDFMRSYQGRVILLDEHLKRLAKSAKLAGLKVPFAKMKIKSVIRKLLRLNKLEQACIRIVITGGQSQDGITYDDSSPTFFILTRPVSPQNNLVCQQGVKLITVGHQRPLAEAKTTCYLIRLLKQKEKQRQRAYEILYCDNGLALECSTSNFFIFKGQTLITAKDNILKGTRRALVLKLAKAKFKVEERPLLVSELKNASEAFLTSTVRNIVPVVRIDKIKIGDGRVGKHTRYLMERLNKYIEIFIRTAKDDIASAWEKK